MLSSAGCNRSLRAGLCSVAWLGAEAARGSSPSGGGVLRAFGQTARPLWERSFRIEKFFPLGWGRSIISSGSNAAPLALRAQAERLLKPSPTWVLVDSDAGVDPEGMGSNRHIRGFSRATPGAPSRGVHARRTAPPVSCCDQQRGGRPHVFWPCCEKKPVGMHVRLHPLRGGQQRRRLRTGGSASNRPG